MRIAIVGTGYVGLVTAVCLAKVGHEVVCVDRCRARLDQIARKEAPFHEPGLADMLAAVVSAGRLSVATDLAQALEHADVSIIAVGTPSEAGAIDLTQVMSAGEAIGAALPKLRQRHTVVLKSTCVPGTTEDRLRPVLEQSSGLQAGRDFSLCVNPEFLREGSAIADFCNADRMVLGALDAAAAEVMDELYTAFDCPKLVTSPRNAEMIKYASNALLATLISFSNEVAQICEAMPGLDEAVVMQGVHLDRRLSAQVDGRPRPAGIQSYIRAGVGYGGSCFPKDTRALSAFAHELGLQPRLLDAVIRVNDERPDELIAAIESAHGPLDGRSVAVLGLAFKPHTDDVRESPGIRIAEACRRRGAEVRGWDPEALHNASTAVHADVQLVADAPAAVAGTDLTVIATAWPELRDLDWTRLAASMRRPLLFDGRGVLAGVELPRDLVRLTVGTAPARPDGPPSR